MSAITLYHLKRISVSAHAEAHMTLAAQELLRRLKLGRTSDLAM